MKSPNHQASRRKFIKGTATALAGFYIVPRQVLGGVGFVAPSDKVNVGIVGAGGRGKENVSDLLGLDDVQVTAVADPAEYWDLRSYFYQSEAGRNPTIKMIEDHYASKKIKSKVAAYEDFKEMLDKEKDMDAILCGTPDHTHAYVSLHAMQAGKHVYCEKPLTHNVWEARMMQKMAREKGLKTQMGNQLHSTPHIRNAVEYLRAGVVGNISEVYSWVPASRWNPQMTGYPKKADPMPKGLNWDLWVGPREMHPFNKVFAPVHWRDYWVYGCGALGDFGCHDMDAATWGLNLPLPESIEIKPAGQHSDVIIPFGEIGYYHFPAANGNGPIKLTWYSGGLQPERPALVPDSFNFEARGAMYIGDKGVMVTGGGTPVPSVFPSSLADSIKLPEPTLAPTEGHHADWIKAIKGGPEASSYFEYGAKLTEITLLGVMSLRLGGKKIYWDAENMKVKGMPEADVLIHEPERKGWEMNVS